MRKDIQIQALNSLLAFRKQGNKPVQGQTTFLDTSYYIIADLTGAGGVQKLITPNTKRVLGLTNFNTNKIDSGIYLVIDSIKISATNTDTARQQRFDDFNSAKLVQNIPDFLDAELIVKQGERTLIKTSIFDLIQIAFPSTNDDIGGYRSISNMPVIAPNEPFEINIEHKTGAEYVSENRNVDKPKFRIDFRVHEFKLV